MNRSVVNVSRWSNSKSAIHCFVGFVIGQGVRIHEPQHGCMGAVGVPFCNQVDTINFVDMSSGLRKKKWFQQIHLSPEDYESFTVIRSYLFRKRQIVA